MGDDFVAPVKLLLKSLDSGIKLSSRILEVSSSASANKALQISESASNVQKSLERNVRAIRDAYHQTFQACGEPFSQALVEDKSIATRFKELKNEVRDKIDECQDFEDDPDSFDPKAFAGIQKESQKCYAECVSIFNTVRGQILQARTSSPPESPKDDRHSLSSMRRDQPVYMIDQVPTTFETPPSDHISPLRIQKVDPGSLAVAPLSPPPPPVPPKSSWSMNGASQFEIGTISPSRNLSRDISPSSLPQQSSLPEQPSYIAKEVVKNRISANDEFLERRRQSKELFQNELHSQSRARSSSTRSTERPNSHRSVSNTIDENRISEVFDDGPHMPSPRLGNAHMATSPTDGRLSRTSSNGYDQMVNRQRSLGQNSHDPRGSRTSSIVHDGAVPRHEMSRNDSTASHASNASHASQDSIFGLRAAAQSPPLSPPLSDGGRIPNLEVENLAATLRTPQFGKDVPDGLEVVSQNYDYSTEKMVVMTSDLPPNNNRNLAVTPTASVKSVDCPMRHDSSFYQMRGFCEGAATLTRGIPGEDWYKIVKRPAGHYSATVSARCIKCAYEVSHNDLMKDKILDANGIYMSSGIRWRNRFVTKSHLRASSINAGLYACVFCVEEHKTIEEHDATVFFSIQQLFRHLARHSQPLPNVPGITVLYGVQGPEVMNFDVHFTSPISMKGAYSMSEIHQKVATRPSAHAIVTHHPKPTSSDSRDPMGQPVMHFAIGARIVGITFPDGFRGEWCSGYHDGEKGHFPANTILLEQPPADDYIMNAKSTLTATARWDFKPKDAKDGGWLKFSKGERLTCVGYNFVDQWCWSGQNAKGKWGIFPRAFVDNLVDDVRSGMAMSPSTKVSSSGFGKMGFSLGRKSSRQDHRPSTATTSSHERSMSIRSTSSGGSHVGGPSTIVEGQAGLEVVRSPAGSVRHGENWR